MVTHRFANEYPQAQLPVKQALLKIRSCTTLGDVARLLGIKPSALSYILYKIPDEQKYRSFTIKKRSGGDREIHAPIDQLKLVQRRLAKHLSDCLSEIEDLEGVDEKCVVSHGFKRKLSIHTNARKHRGRRFVFCADLEEFFPSINFGRVKGYFEKNRHFNLNAKVALILSQICCWRGSIPQGAPTSPVISNLIGNILDSHLSDLASRNNCTYTRYADDITFSTNLSHFPEVIAIRDPRARSGWRVGDELRTRIIRTGFRPNDNKSRMAFQFSRQTVTGLVVNDRVNVTSEFYKTTRAMCHRLFETGTYESGIVTPVSPERFLAPLEGRLSFLCRIKSDEYAYRGEDRPPSWGDKAPNFLRLYRQFLNYKWFYGNRRPTIIGEGPTDGIYIGIAIKHHVDDFPGLAIRDGKEVKLIPKIFKYTDNSESVQGLGGGSGQLNLLIGRYKKDSTIYRAAKPAAPAIIICDNDDGGKSIFSAIGAVKKSGKVDGSEKFYHVYGNLYVVPLPKISGANTDIEHLISDRLLTLKSGGREFHRGGAGYDSTRHFGKVKLADLVAKAETKPEDFKGFRPVLDAISLVQRDYADNGWR